MRLKKTHLDDVERLRDDLRFAVKEYRMAKGSVRGTITEMKKQDGAD